MRMVAAALALVFAACGPKPKHAAAPTPEPEPATPEAIPTPPSEPVPKTKRATPAPKPALPKPTPIKRVPVSTQPPPAELWKEFSGERAWRTARELVEFGPRPAGSMELGRARGLLLSALRSAGWEVEQQSFTATTPKGELPGANLIARFAADGARPVPRTSRSILIGAHYDTRYFSTINFVGANEGASGPAVLAEVARVLALDPQLAAKVELVLFDVSEPRSQFTAEDGLAGSKHFAKTAAPRRAAILHGVGDAADVLTLPSGTAIEFLADVRAAVTAVHRPLKLEVSPVRLWGDHLPFGANGLLLGNHNAVTRYTADDTIERVTPATLGSVGEVVIWLAKHWAAQP